jgi:transposase InsO family protein
MEYFNTKLCLLFDELVPAVMGEKNYHYYRGEGSITVHGRGGNGRKVLIEFESLPPKYKGMVRDIYGDPYVFASKQPIINSLLWDHKAQQFYSEYTLPNGDSLPDTDTDVMGKAQINYVHRYTEAASWLNLMIRLTTDKAALKRELNIPVMTFWEQATEVIKVKGVNLPGNPKRLKDKIKQYQLGGYPALIETHKWGNDHSKKIKDEEAEAFIKAFLSHRNKYDDTVIADKYNTWATETGRDTISPGAVGYWRKKWASYLLLEREGVAKFYNKISKEAIRKRPEDPLSFINSDDNVLDAFFRSGDNKWYRPVIYVVLDAFNDYVLGYAVGDSVTKELVKEAYRNAMRHVIALTGDAYCWRQIQTDHWGISGKNTTEIEQFYNSMATFTPAGLKNAQTKYIERFFGTTWHQQLKEAFPRNYSGQNVTAKEKLNPDKLFPTQFPDVSEAPAMIDAFIWRMRLTTRKGSQLNRHEEWVTAFRSSEKSQSKLLTPEMRLQIFGKKHDFTNEITTKGVTPTIGGKRLVYELSQEIIFNHIGKSVQVIYDEYDLSQVLITDGRGLRILANEYNLLPSAIADYKEGDRERILALGVEKKSIMPAVKEWGKAKEIEVSRGGIDIESRLQAGVMTKEINHNDIRDYQKNRLEAPKKAISKKEEAEESFWDEL